jgi:hypothetical protein
MECTISERMGGYEKPVKSDTFDASALSFEQLNAMAEERIDYLRERGADLAQRMSMDQLMSLGQLALEDGEVGYFGQSIVRMAIHQKAGGKYPGAEAALLMRQLAGVE